MRRILSSIAICFTVLLGSAFGQTGGRDLYIAKCSACHAPDGSGSNTIGRSLKLGDMRPVIQSMTDEQLRQIMLEGKGKMPPLKKFDDEKVRNLTVFLRDLAAGDPNAGRAVAEAQAQPLSHIEEVFRDKCSACHGQDGIGRTTIGKSLKIPDLTSAAVQSQSVEELAEVISRGRGRMPGYAKTFNPVQVGQFVSYIRALTKSDSAKEPVESAKAPGSTPPPSPPPPTQITARPEPNAPPSPNSAASTVLLKSPAAEEMKTAEPNLTIASKGTKAPKSGRQIYAAKCSACHSSDGSGRGTIGRSMRIPSLTSPQVQGQSDEILTSVISNGDGKMPAYKKKYNPEQIELLVAYIRELGKKRRSVP
jgi:mono/diheme cytochrome c family protein